MDSRPSFAFWVLALILVIAALYGFYFYLPVYSSTSPALWVFVPDSPAAILFGLLAILALGRGEEEKPKKGLPGIGKGRAKEIIEWLASISLLKYGIWTVAVMAYFYPQEYLAGGRFLESLLLFIIPHLGMVALAVAVIPGEKNKLPVVLALSFFLLNDYADYFLGIEGAVIPEGRLAEVAVFSFALTLASFAFVLGFGHKLVPWKERIRGKLYAPIRDNAF